MRYVNRIEQRGGKKLDVSHAHAQANSILGNVGGQTSLYDRIGQTSQINGV